MSLIVIARAKINLGLRVVGRRPDGFHDLETIMVPVSVADRVELDPSASGVTVESDSALAPGGPGNLAHRAAEAFARASGRTVEVTIRLRKRIPVAAGLGGGSSDAAAVLVGLNRLSGRPLSDADLVAVGRDLGADVPFFLGRGPALAQGIGDLLTPLDDFPLPWLVLVHPPVAVSTAKIYGRLAPSLTTRPACSIFESLKSSPWPRSRTETGSDPGPQDLERLARLLVNDLEPVTEALHPVVGQIKARLLAAGAAGASMTGSGPAVFGLLATGRQAARCRRALAGRVPGRVMVARVCRRPLVLAE
jgi:4-diphosphocytidyl-2-C-methyl-D-erythritol kinase